VLRGIDHVHPAGEHGDRPPAGVEGGAVGNAVDAARQAADHRHVAPGQLGRQPVRHLAAVGGGVARPDHGHAPLVLGTELPAQVEHRRRVVDIGQAGRVGRVGEGLHGDARALQALHHRRDVDTRPRRHGRGHGLGVESRFDQRRRRGGPGLLHAAEGLGHAAHALRPDAGQQAKGDPIGSVGRHQLSVASCQLPVVRHS